MLLDNENSNLKVYEWIDKYTKEGKLDAVTGYFTIGALAWLSQRTNDKIEEYRFVLGDIITRDELRERTLNLLNENITVEAAMRLSTLAREAVDFLNQDKVIAKTLEPNFCHAKMFVYKNKENDSQLNYFITGSSNITEAGMGMRHTSNVELNIAGFGADNQYDRLIEWFDLLWNKKQCHKTKTIVDAEGKENMIDFKEYLIHEIEKVFVEYSPRQIYFKILFELFGSQLLLDSSDPDFNRQLGRLENTVIYNALYDYQKKGVLSLIKMLNKYNGAILADAVGLGKTWTALAVMKHYMQQGREVILLCPKKLRHNWHAYLVDQESRFEADELKYFIRYHTDLCEERLEKYKDIDRRDTLFQKDKPKLFVIDESHNLRNDKSQRYQFFVEEILKKNDDVKVLLLSATPINNSLLDIRNQFKLLVQGKNDGFKESLGIRNLEATFRSAQISFNKWSEEQEPKLGDFIKELPANFFRLTDSLTVSRTRKMIIGQGGQFDFPKKDKPENYWLSVKNINPYSDFNDLVDNFPPMLSAYQPAYYADLGEKKNILEDQKQRDRFLVKMLYILLVKRLESSWYSFDLTINKILSHHKNALSLINQYKQKRGDATFEELDEIWGNSEEIEEFDDFALGKKNPIQISDIDRAGMIERYEEDIKIDIAALEKISDNLKAFESKIDEEKRSGNYISNDEKLEKLIALIHEKRSKGLNEGNEKVLVFTTYKDTAYYLYDHLLKRGFKKLAVVTGDDSAVYDMEGKTSNFEHILERFVPYTKLFIEREWQYKPSSENMPLKDQYEEWKGWMKENRPKEYKTVEKPIDILIATDTLSEGQNLQDCDYVINYDIHWNPVRVIQRMGRIDRLGSPNEVIKGINFWPSKNIEEYLNLQGRIERRMAIMKLAGSEVNIDFSDSFKEMADNEDFERKQNERMMKQMEISWDDLEIEEKTFGFDDLSLEVFRQALMEELKNKEHYYKSMPCGVYTGFIKKDELCPTEGIIALLGYPARMPSSPLHEYKSFDLLYLDTEGNPVKNNQKEVLDALTKHKDEVRNVPIEVDRGEPEAIKKYSEIIKKWLKSQVVSEDGTAGEGATDVLRKLKTGDIGAVEAVKDGITVEEYYDKGNVDLIAWFIVGD